MVVGTLSDGYIRNVPLPRAPRIQSASHVTCHGAVTRDGSTPLHSTPPVNSTSRHSTHVQADRLIQSTSHVPCHGAITPDGSTPLHSTPRVNSTTLHSTCIQADPQIKQASHVTCYGAVMHDGSTPLHSTPYAYVPAAPWIQGRGHVTSHGPVTHDNIPEPDTCYLQVPLVPSWSDLIRSLTGLD
jgi:hypothetical protein